mmetsp:Transcript_15597/g.35463  ORF Transcript_15597/g.35463 Transcript_15597/m.35463 type:complete len:342 (-) Transcript_15597:81-1106(-)
MLLLLAASPCGRAQMPMGGAPSPNSLLNDLRAIQFPAGGDQQAAGAFGMAGGMGMPQGMPQGMGGMPMGGMQQGMPQGMGMGGAPGMPQQGVSDPPPDLACTASPRTPAWGAAKQHFRALFPGRSVPQLASREAMSSSMEGALRDLKSMEALGPQAVDECGLGKLCLQLLSFASIDDPTALVQLFSGFEQLSSPVLTMLLDVPWVALAAAGWPIFGLMSQLNLRRSHVPGALNNDAVDGLDDPVNRAFQMELKSAPDHAAVEKAAAAYLQKETKGSALGPLTAMAAQAAGSSSPQERMAILQGLQVGFKQVIGSPGELDIAMGTQWPLWSYLHAAIEGLTV